MAKYAVEDADYLDLWKYFEERAETLKESMFQSVTWVLGFAAAVLGFTLTSFVDFEASTVAVKHRWLAILSCFIGLLLCLYAHFLLEEFAEHIRRNWDRANRCKSEVVGLSSIIRSPSREARQVETRPNALADQSTAPPSHEEHKAEWEIWQKIGVIVVLFAVVFIVVAIVCIVI